MSFSIGYLDVNESIHIKSFDDHNTARTTSQIVSPNELPEQDLKALFVELDRSQMNAALDEILKTEAFYYPICPSTFFGLDQEQFSSLDFEKAQLLTKKVHSSWIVNNNLRTIENIGPISKTLKEKWALGPESFAVDLWDTLRSNLGSEELRIIYRDLEIKKDKEQIEKLENEDEVIQTKSSPNSKKLIHNYIVGKKTPNTYPGGDIENNLMEIYAIDSPKGKIFIHQVDDGPNNLVASCKIDKSPLLIMSKGPKISLLQKSIIEGVFNAISI